MEKISKIYQTPEIIEEMKNFFDNEGFIQLSSFFEEKYILDIVNKINKEKIQEIYKPMSHKFKEINEIKNLEILKLFEFFRTKDFLEFIEEITEFELQNPKVKIKKYSHKDYTILNDLLIDKNDKIEIFLDLTPDWDYEYGGILTYLTKIEEIFYIEPTFNSLTIIYKPKELLKYLKYINNLSKNKEIIRFEISYDIIN